MNKTSLLLAAIVGMFTKTTLSNHEPKVKVRDEGKMNRAEEKRRRKSEKRLVCK